MRLYMINPFCTTFAGGAIEITLTGITDGDSACTLSNLSNISNCSGTDPTTEYSRKLIHPCTYICMMCFYISYTYM